MEVTSDLEVHEGDVENGICVFERVFVNGKFQSLMVGHFPTSVIMPGSVMSLYPHPHPPRRLKQVIYKHTSTETTTFTMWPSTGGGDGEDTEKRREAEGGRLWMG